MKNTGLLVIIIILLSFMSTAHSTIWYVHPDSVLNTIQAGLNACSTGDTVLVAAGIYYENLIWPTLAGIKLLSESGPNSTIIDGDSTGRIITMPGSFIVDSSTVVEGFTLRNGVSNSGGAISCFHASPKIVDNRIMNNCTSGGGGAICSYNANLIIVNNIISGNSAQFGGGIYLTTEDKSTKSLTVNYRLHSVISNNTITNNQAHLGGGIFWYNEWSTNFEANTITDNHAVHGGGMFCVNSDGCIISSNTITGNTSDSIGGGIYLGEYTGNITCNVIVGNDAGIIADGIYFTDGYSGIPWNINYNNIYNNGYALFNASSSQMLINAECNWWGDATGPYHSTLNPGGLGDTVSDKIDFDPWLCNPWVIEEQSTVKLTDKYKNLHATIFRGPLQLPEGKKYRVFDIVGRAVEPNKIQPGIYFIAVDGVVTQKVVKIR
jgi:hypothetical protein